MTGKIVSDDEWQQDAELFDGLIDDAAQKARAKRTKAPPVAETPTTQRHARWLPAAFDRRGFDISTKYGAKTVVQGHGMVTERLRVTRAVTTNVSTTHVTGHRMRFLMGETRRPMLGLEALEELRLSGFFVARHLDKLIFSGEVLERRGRIVLPYLDLESDGPHFRYGDGRKQWQLMQLSEDVGIHSVHFVFQQLG